MKEVESAVESRFEEEETSRREREREKERENFSRRGEISFPSRLPSTALGGGQDSPVMLHEQAVIDVK